MKKSKIAFLSIFDLTRVFYSISEKLTDEADFFWITTNQLWTEYLLEKGVPKERILELVYTKADFLDADEKKVLEKELAELETRVDLTIYQCLLMDRFVMMHNRPDIMEFVFLYYKNIRNFIRSNEIEAFFGEPTAFNELITYLISSSLGIDFIAPWHMRYPSDRVVFTTGYLNHELIRLDNVGDRPKGGDFLVKYQKEVSVPSYFKLNNASRILAPGKILKSIRNRIEHYRKYSTSHLTHYPLMERIRYKLRRVINSFILKKIYQYPKLDEINTRIAFYGIHVQPERSIDVVASYFSDQIKLIKDMRRSLPVDFTLVVKEHPNGLGAKQLKFYREIKGIPGVKLVSHANSTFDIYERCELILTVSGTTAYEAGMLGIPAIMFSPLYFNRLSTITYCSDISKLKDMVIKSLKTKQDLEHDKVAMEDMFENSWEAYWTDPLTDPRVLDDENVQKLANGLKKVIEVRAGMKQSVDVAN